MSDELALLMAVPLRHLQSVPSGGGPVTLPAGAPGDLDAVPSGTTVLVIATEAGETEVPAATWRAVFSRRVPYDLGSQWPDGLPSTWVEEHPVPDRPEPPRRGEDGDGTGHDEDDDPWDEDDQEDEDVVGGQSFLEVARLEPLPREAWMFANELVGKQARGGRSFRPRAPIIVSVAD